MKYRISKVNSWNGWDPLEQIVLGSAFSPEFFEDIKDHKLRDLLQQLMQETRDDLDAIQKAIETFGADVVRLPENMSTCGTVSQGDTIGDFYEANHRNWDSHIDENGLPKPAIAPRDWLITLGNKLVLTHAQPGLADQLKTFIDPAILDTRLADTCDYSALGPFDIGESQCKKFGINYEQMLIPGTPEYEERLGLSWFFDAPLLTRVGDRIIVDTENRPTLPDYILSNYPQYKQAHVALGRHSDGSFCPVKPGHIVSAEWHTNYKDTFPDWDVHVIQDPEDVVKLKDWNKLKGQTGGKWWTPEASNNPELVSFVEQWMNKWVGYAAESRFEVNMLVLDPHNILCLNYNKGVFDYLESIGMNPILVPFRHRNFWDGGLHCLTVDTYRTGKCQSYFGD